jgi:polysaccharide pyruvyl transferase WcaK-like protein
VSGEQARPGYVVWGAAYATRNIGDMAIARAIVDLLRRAEPDAEIVFITSGRHDAHLSAYDGVRVIDAWRQPIRLLRLLRESKLLLVAGGVPFGDSTPSLLRCLALAAAARAAGAKVRVLASSAADARLDFVNELLCRAILSLTSSISVRDRTSMRLFQRLKGADAIGFVPDLALSLDLRSQAASRFRPPGLADGEPYVLIAPRNFLADQPYLRTHFSASFDTAEAPALLAAISRTVEALGRERRIVFLPMNVDEGDDVVGRRVAEQMAERGRQPIVIEDPLTVDQACALIEGAALVLGMRLHAVIFGIALQRPTIALAYAGKVAGFMDWLGLAEDALPLTASSEQVIEACERRLQQGVPPHVPPAMDLARQQIADGVAALRHRSASSLLALRDPA